MHLIGLRRGHRARAVTRNPVVVATATLATLVTMNVVLGSQTAYGAPDDNGIFELDANVLDNPAGGADDWQDILNGTDSAFLDTGIVADLVNDQGFTGGGSKDDLDIPKWRHKVVSNQLAKDNITNGYAAAYSDGNDSYVYFGMDRESRLGSSFLGTWLLKDSTFGANADGTFSGNHVAHDDNGTPSTADDTPGDVLVLTEFNEGGTGIHIKVFEWVGSGGDEGTNGELKTIYGSNTTSADCDETPSSVPVCANVNTTKLADADIPWPYSGKAINNAGVTASDMAPGVFFEGGMNLDALFGESPCFSDIVLETRTSFSTDAVLKDLVMDDFELCGADVSIAPDGVNKVGDPHTWTVTATKTVAGNPSPAAITQGGLTVTLKDANGNTITPTTNECANGPAANLTDGTCDVTFVSNTPGVITGHVSGNVTVGESAIAVATGGAGQNPDATKIYVDARIGIGQDGVNGIDESHTFTVLAEANKGAGWGAITDGHVSFALDQASTVTPTVDTAASTCDDAGDNLDANGKCTIVFTSSTAGTVKYNASVSATLSTTEGNIAVTATTDGLSTFGSTNSGPATKVFKDGTLTWIKHDDQGNLLPGATFYVCRTQAWNSDTSSYDNIADTDNDLPDTKANDSRCIVVTDDKLADDPDATTPDADDTGGLFKLEHLALGTYTIQEKDAPEGYALDPDEETLQINTTTTSAKPTKEEGGNIVDKPFIDPALFKVIVLTCNTSTEKLVVSEVDEAPGTAGGVKDTLAAGSLTAQQQADLCGLDGANYDNKLRGDHTYEVTIPKP